MEGKPIIIVFEGIDKSGKTTIKDEFNKATNFKYVVLDRFTSSSKVYNKLFRRDEAKYYNDVENAFKNAFDVLIVLCECDDDTNAKRLNEANENLPEQLKDIGNVKKMFDEETKCFENVIRLDTSNKSVQECVLDVIKKVNEMKERKENKIRIVFDVDDTISSNARRLGYDKCIPNFKVINKINYLHDKLNFYIVLHTARGMISCEGNLEKIISKNKNILEEWLKKYDVHYDELIFGKPIADLYVDDRCIDVKDFCEKDFCEVKGGGSGKPLYRLGKIIKKTFGSDEEASNFKDWIDDNKFQCRYPSVISYLYDSVFMDFIDGDSLSECLTKFDVFDLICTIKNFSNKKYADFDLDVQLDVLNKNRFYDDEVDDMIDICEEFLKDNADVLKENASFSHGDMILSNVIKDDLGLCFIDPRYFRNSSSYLLDFGKLRMSLSGYEKNFGLSKVDNSRYLHILDYTLKEMGIYDIVIGLNLMYVLRLCRYKDDDDMKIVKKMAMEILNENEELFGMYKKS